MIPRETVTARNRKTRRRFVLLIISIAVIFFIAGYNTQSAWELWADEGVKGAVEGTEALGGAGNAASHEGGNVASAAGRDDGAEAAQSEAQVRETAGSKNTASGQIQKAPEGGNTVQKTNDPGGAAAVKLDKPTLPVVQYTAKTGSKLVALTFDDGPDNHYTPAILDILKEYNVKATFFTVGTQVKKYPDMMKRIVKEGHEIGNHTYHHKDLTKLDSLHIGNEIMWTDTLIQKAVGFVPRLVRAPYGATNNILDAMIAGSKRDLVGWTVDTRDWAGESVASIRANVNKNTKPGGIILMHSFGSSHIKNSVAALPGVIKDLQKKGYTFVTVDQLLAAKKH
ncbi:polysaccharide deacetylase family protein [Paenibacillus sepulcri]|uniref:Polysaccharide deacetylase family protein n=1 Tax=Paenibacillus sepulcri TaxID=359917 RepID=A0ABS7C8G5_9BACL|nr:polysaccharide deacetylase family protein [Paenibacillus sepulcri]